MDFNIQLTRVEGEVLMQAIDRAQNETCYDLNNPTKFPEGTAFYLRLEALRIKLMEAME